MTDKNPRPPPDTPDSDDFTNQWPLELSEYLKFDDNQWMHDDLESFASEDVSNQVHQASNVGHGGGSSHFEESSSNVVRERVAFKTKSEIEVLEDGYKWRKYGKKMVKNSPNPRLLIKRKQLMNKSTKPNCMTRKRNYYRCSVDGCYVKKRVERDKDDPRYVITTYEGNHTHPSSC